MELKRERIRNVYLKTHVRDETRRGKTEGIENGSEANYKRKDGIKVKSKI